MESSCFFCGKPTIIKAKFECEVHQDEFAVCDSCMDKVSHCVHCKTKPLSDSSSLQFLYLINTSINDKNSFPLITYNKENYETTISFVSAKPGQDDFAVYEYAGIAKLSERQFVLTGGEEQAGCTNEVFVLTFELIGQIFAYSWYRLPECLAKRYTHRLFLLDSQRFLIAGGLDENRNFLNTCEVFADNVWKNAPALNKARSQASGFAKNDYVYIFGGFSGPKIQESSFERISCKDVGKWEEINVKNNGFSFMTACFCVEFIQSQMLIVGGSNGVGATKEMWSWDLEKQEINKLKEELIYQRANFIGKIIDKGELLVLGGENTKIIKVEKVGLGNVLNSENDLESEEEQSVFAFPGYFWFGLE